MCVSELMRIAKLATGRWGIVPKPPLWATLQKDISTALFGIPKGLEGS